MHYKNMKTETGIELLNLDPKYPHFHKSTHRNQFAFHQMAGELQTAICRLFRQHSTIVDKQSSNAKVYQLFYVNPLAIETGLWDFFVIITIYIFQIQISLTLGFGPDFWKDEMHSGYHFIGYVICLLILCIDILINFHKGYYAFGRGRVIDDPHLIIKHYLKANFIIDIAAIALLVIALIINQYTVNFLQLVPAILLYFKKFKCQKQIEGMLQYYKKFRIFFILLMLGCDVMLIGHIGACIFVGVDLLLWRLQYYGNDPQYYWLSNNSMYPIDLMQGDWLLQYIYAQSFSTGTLSTIAPGPFGKNPIQIMYSNFVMIFFMILASYVAQVLVSILLSEDQIRTFHEDNIQRFDKFMKLKGVTEKISSRIHNFFQLIWEAEIKMNVEDEKQVLEKLPISLKEQLLVEMGFVKNLKLIQYFSHSELIEKLVSIKITSVIIDSDTTLFTAGTPPAAIQQRYLFYFKDGLAKFFISTHNQQFTLSVSNMQRTVGQFQFVTGLAYSYSCKSVDLCIVSRVANADMLQAIQQNGMIEEYQSLKYKLLIQNELNIIGKKCIVCENQHTEDKCPEINPSLQIANEMKNKIWLGKHQRAQHKRNKFRSGIVRSINEKAIAKAHILLLFLTYKGLSGLIINISTKEFQLDKVTEYEKYYKDFNV